MLPSCIPETKFSIVGFPESKFYPPCDPKKKSAILPHQELLTQPHATSVKTVAGV
jgi:hypothetical protein